MTITLRLYERAAAWAKANNAKHPLAWKLVAGRVDLTDKAEVKGFVEALGGARDLIVIDTLARCMSGDENTQKDMSAFVAGCDRIRAATGAAVLVIHHEGKDAGKGARGSNVLRGRCFPSKTINWFMSFCLEANKTWGIGTLRNSDSMNFDFALLFQTPRRWKSGFKSICFPICREIESIVQSDGATSRPAKSLSEREMSFSFSSCPSSSNGMSLAAGNIVVFVWTAFLATLLLRAGFFFAIIFATMKRAKIEDRDS